MYKGVFTAIITPFNADETVDYGALKEQVEFQISQGISGLVPVGTTGESPTLTHKENLEVVEAVVKTAAGRVPVIAGTGSNNTTEAVKMTTTAKEIGADASLQVAPYYNKPSQEGFYRHFTTIADKIDMPHIIYNIPGRTGKNIETPTLLKMAEHKNIVAVKEASGDLGQMMDVISNCPSGFSVLSGDDNMAVPLTLMGGHGVISVASNLIPAEMENMIKLALEGNAGEATKEHYRLMKLFKSMFLDTNPVPVKTAMAMMGKTKEVFRLPICETSDEIKAALTEVLKEMKLL